VSTAPEEVSSLALFPFMHGLRKQWRVNHPACLGSARQKNKFTPTDFSALKVPQVFLHILAALADNIQVILTVMTFNWRRGLRSARFEGLKETRIVSKSRPVLIIISYEWNPSTKNSIRAKLTILFLRVVNLIFLTGAQIHEWGTKKRTEWEH
jgi:hypothetical protein